MTSVFSCSDDTKNIYSIVHRQKRKHIEAVSYYVAILQQFGHKVSEIFIIMNQMLSVKVKEFFFHLFVKVYSYPMLECYMDWFLSLICENYIFKHFVKTLEPTSLKFCTIIELITLHLQCTIAQVKYANFSRAHVQIFILLNGAMAIVSTGFRKLKFWLWLLRTVFYLNQTSF